MHIFIEIETITFYVFYVFCVVFLCVFIGTRQKKGIIAFMRQKHAQDIKHSCVVGDQENDQKNEANCTFLLLAIHHGLETGGSVKSMILKLGI